MVDEKKLQELLNKVKTGNVDDLNKYLEEIESAKDIDPVIDKMKNIHGDIVNLDEKYKEQKRLYTTLVDNLPGAVYRSENDLKWPFSYVSEGIKKFTGYVADDFITRKIFYGDLIADDYRQLVWDEVQKALEARLPFRLIYKINDKEGNEHWVWEQGTGVFSSDNEFQFIEGFITDITDKIKLQANLEEEAEKLEKINKAVTDREVHISKLKKSIEDVKKLIS